jgi:hypothetical protein
MRLTTLVLSSIFFAGAAAPVPINPAVAAWSSERDPALGFAYSYPSDLFDRIEGDGKPSFHYFSSEDSEAKFLVGGWDNSAGQSPASLKRWMMENVGGYDELTYRPRGRSWFVLSGYRGDTIYYEKVMFSCRDRLVNVFAITYPISQREIYDPVVERMENAFTPGSRCP